MCIPNILYMQYYSMTAYVHIKGPVSIQLKKLAQCAKKGCLVGYKGNNEHIYCVWIPTENKIVQLHNMTFNKAPDLLIAILEDELTVWELEPEWLLEPQSLTTTVVTIVTYFAAKALEEKEHCMGELEGLCTPDSVLKELSPRGATLQSFSSLEPGLLIQLNQSLS